MQLVAHFGNRGDGARFLALEGYLEQRFVLVRVELQPDRIQFHQAVFGENFLDLHLRHHQPVVQVLQVRILRGHFRLRDALRRLLQDVRHLKQVFTETLDSLQSSKRKRKQREKEN